MSKRIDRKQAARVLREQQERERRRRRTAWISAAASVVLLVAGLVGYRIYAAQQPDDGFRAPAGATADLTGVRVGNGPVTVELYLDYLCPACRAFENDAQATIDRYLDAGRISMVYHPVAILDRYSTNRYSSRSAAGAGCAADAGRLVDYTKALYARQPAEGGSGHTDEQLIDIAIEAGLPSEPFGACVREGRYADWVSHVTEGMGERNVRGTPTVFVNGKELADRSAQALSAAIDAA